MGKLTDLLRLAGKRGHDLGLSYAGALTPAEAWEVWQLAPGARLIDVRTRAELHWIGRIPGAVEIEWENYPEKQANADFLQQLTGRLMVGFPGQASTFQHQLDAFSLGQLQQLRGTHISPRNLAGAATFATFATSPVAAGFGCCDSVATGCDKCGVGVSLSQRVAIVSQASGL